MAIRFMEDKKKRYLFLLPVIFLLLNALFFQHASKMIRNSILLEKYADAVNQIEALAAAVEEDHERWFEDHEINIRHFVEFLDNLPMIYAAAYKPTNNELTRFTERYFSTSFDIQEYDEFYSAIETQDVGNLDIHFTAEDGLLYDLRLYFRYMPLYAPPENRYLVVMGISSYSIITPIPTLVSIGQWISMSLTFALNIWLVIMISRIDEYSKVRVSKIYPKQTGGDDIV